MSERGTRLNRVIWDLVDDRFGETYQSIPTDIPWNWRRDVEGPEGEWIAYVCGEYEIQRVEYGKGWSFVATRQSCPIGDWVYARLKDAKAACWKNARGEERRHFA